MKKLIKMMVSVFLIVILSVPVYAAESDTRDGEEALSSVANNSFLTTIEDDDNNKYRVGGNCLGEGKKASVRTQFEVSYIGDGLSDTKVYNYTKKLTAKGDVTMSGGATNSVGSTVSKTGKSGYYNPSKTFLYTVRTIVATHKFVCNGETYSILTYY